MGKKASFTDLTQEANAHSIACRRTMPALRENLSAHYQLKHGRKKKTTRKRKKNKQNNLPVNKKTKLIHVKQEPKVKVETPT